MKSSFAGLWLLVVGSIAACGGPSREPETAQNGAAGGSGAGADACAVGKDNYQHQRDEVLQTAAASGCKQDADCGTLWETNACVSRCGTTLPAAAVDAATAQLSELAKGVCSTCPPMPVPPCAPPGPLKCVEGRCSEGP